jgi:PleD family two-component response regulator
MRKRNEFNGFGLQFYDGTKLAGNLLNKFSVYKKQLAMGTVIQNHGTTEPVNVLLVGNNPIEMGRVMEKLQQVRGCRIITEIAFDLKSIVERLMRFHPNFILIDDNLGKTDLLNVVNALSLNRRTKNVPITVLKNSNYQESPGSMSVLDYLLKQNLSPEGLYNNLKNSLKLRRTQLYLYQAYRKRKNQLLKIA